MTLRGSFPLPLYTRRPGLPGASCISRKRETRFCEKRKKKSEGKREKGGKNREIESIECSTAAATTCDSTRLGVARHTFPPSLFFVRSSLPGRKSDFEPNNSVSAGIFPGGLLALLIFISLLPLPRERREYLLLLLLSAVNTNQQHTEKKDTGAHNQKYSVSIVASP